MRRRRDLTDTLGRELKHATRALLRSKTFTSMTVLTLALALGAVTAIFAILDRVVLRPLPYPNGTRLVSLTSPVPGIKASPLWGIARHEMLYFKRVSHTLEDLGVYQTGESTVMGDGSAHQAERIPTAAVSGSLFSVLGIVPEVGRLLTAEDNNNPALEKGFTVGVLSHGFWQRRFGGDPSIVGKSINLDGYPMTVVGIVPPSAQNSAMNPAADVQPNE